MVMLTRGWSKFLVLVGFMLETFGVLVPALDDDEPADGEVAATAVQLQSVVQAPPPAPMNRFIYDQPQNHRHVPQDDTWWMQMPAVLRDLQAKETAS